jgi:hypothetical protein
LGIGSDSDGDSEHNEDVIELPSAHDCEVLDNFDELPFCVSQKSERGDMHEKPEKRDVVDDINPEGGHDNKKTADMHENPEKSDDIDSNFDFNFDFDPESNEDVIETVEMQTHDRPEKRCQQPQLHIPH